MLSLDALEAELHDLESRLSGPVVAGGATRRIMQLLVEVDLAVAKIGGANELSRGTTSARLLAAHQRLQKLRRRALS